MTPVRRLCFAVLFLTAALGAEEAKNPVSSVLKEILPRQQKNIVGAVETMPAEKFSYKPTPEQMTFGHLVVHIIESNNYLCAKAGDTAAPKVEELKESDSKEKLVSALKASFDFCNTALAKTDDSKLGDTIEVFGGRQAPRAFAFIALASGWADHYGAAAMYLRLNGLLPPTAKKAAPEQKPEPKK
ncbi:MAG TPA: DinB family protein [Terriglobales bacterium]|nr:DinB family protein [Terriglobales bacterium]